MASGRIKTGARTWLNLIQKLCHLSHIKGFRNGLGQILGEPVAGQIYDLWTPLCTAVEAAVALDDWFNAKDATEPNVEGPSGTDEDVRPA